MENNTETLGMIVETFNVSELKTGNAKIFPSVEALACLSHAVYYQKFKSKIIYDVTENRDNQIKVKEMERSWKLIGSAECKVLIGGDGYHGAAYYNESTKHIVIAHRGTELSNMGSLWADVKGIMFNGDTSQMKSAYIFTKLIVDKFWECAISISVTGHSLGGWLSQTSAFFMKYPNFAEEFSVYEGHKLNIDIILSTSRDPLKKNSHHLHVIVFDSPGVLNIVERCLHKNIPRYSDDRYLSAKYLNSLDLTTYFSSPNAINSSNLHIGSLFMMTNISDKKGSWTKWKDTIEFLKYTFDSHNMKKIVNFWQFPADDKLILKVTDWPVGLAETNKYHGMSQLQINEFNKMKFKADPIDISLLRMTVFEMEEREFLEDIQYLKSFGVNRENSPWEFIFKNKDMTQANCIIDSVVKNPTQAKNIYEFFDSFQILIDTQVLRVEKHFEIDCFILLVKYFVKATNDELDLPKLVKDVISKLPKVYQAIYQGFSKEYLNKLPQIEVQDFAGVRDFLESSEYKIYQAVAQQSPIICTAKIIKVLYSKSFSFAGSEEIKFNKKNTLIVSSDLLTILNRHVSISRIVPPKDGLKLILIEITSDQIEPTLHTLIKNVLDSSPLIKLILVTPKKIDVQLLQFDISTHCFEKEIPVSEQSILFQDLSGDQQNIILDSEVCFQGENVPLKNIVSFEELKSNADLLDHYALVSLLSQTSKISFGGAVPALSDFDKSFYIHRHFRKIVLKDPKQMLPFLGAKKSVLVISYDGIESKNDILRFLFPKNDANFSVFEWCGNFEGYSPGKHRVILVEYNKIPVNYIALWSHFKTIDLTGYWFNYDTRWYWHATFGKQTVQNLNIEYAEKYDESEMFELQRPLVIITDEPGMGKSTLLKYFAQKCKNIGREQCKTSWVIFINLENSKQLLSALRAINIITLMDFLSTYDSSSSNSIGTCILNHLLQQDGRVTIFFDGLDEVTIDIQSKVFTIAKTLLNHTKAKVYVASRLHLRSSLESYFSNYINKFIPLTEPERIDFLAKFWTNHPDFVKYEKAPMSMDIIKSFASHLLNELQSSLNIMQADSFIGVPLQLFMLGNITLAQAGAFYSQVQETSQPIDSNTLQEHTLIFGNIFNLYQMFVSEKCRISLEEKCKLIQLSEHYPWHNQILTSSIIELHRKSSFYFLFPNESQSFPPNDFLDREEIQVLLGVGIVHSLTIDLNSIQFIHRSLAEYFAADFLVSRLTMPHLKDRAVDFLKKNIFLPHFDKIRFFIDHFISIQTNCDPIFRKCLEWEKEKLNILEMLENSENTETLDLLGRNVLHYAICYGDHNYGILWILIQNQHLFYKTDVFGCGFLSYIVLLPNLTQLHFLHPWVTLPNFLRCFHSKLDKVEQLQDLKWIFWFSGQRVNELNKMWQGKVDIEMTRSKFKKEIEADLTFFGRAKQIQKFSQIIQAGPANLPTDLNVAAMRGDSESVRPSKVRMFVDFMVDHIDSAEKYLQPFEIAMEIGGEGHVKVGIQLYEKVKLKYTKIAHQMLDIMACNNFSLFKNSIEFIGEDLVIESDLWFHCIKQKNEMFDIISTANFLTFRRALKVMNWRKEGGKLVDEFFLIYQQLKDETIRKTMIEIIRDDDDLASKTAFQFKILCSCSIWKFLPTVEVREQVLEKYYDTLNSHVIGKIRDSSVQSDFKRLAKFLLTIYDSVGVYWQSKIKEDVHVNLKLLRMKVFL